MIAEGHTFERARREFGFEEGVFVDGAYLSSHEGIAFVELSIEDRQQQLAEARLASKTFACTAVQSYMEALQVTLDDLTHDPNARAIRTWREALLLGR